MYTPITPRDGVSHQASPPLISRAHGEGWPFVNASGALANAERHCDENRHSTPTAEMASLQIKEQLRLPFLPLMENNNSCNINPLRLRMKKQARSLSSEQLNALRQNNNTSTIPQPFIGSNDRGQLALATCAENCAPKHAPLIPLLENEDENNVEALKIKPALLNNFDSIL